MQQEEREMSAPEFWLKLTPANVKKWYSQAKLQLTSIKQAKSLATASWYYYLSIAPEHREEPFY